MSWRVAESLKQLRAQLSAAFPSRSKVSDGSIGDEKHSSRSSDHNPNERGVVCAIDITHDIQKGVNCRWLADQLVESRDERIKYIIFDGKIISSEVAVWTWRTYHGANKHKQHLHISVKAEKELYDSTKNWDLDIAVSIPFPKVSNVPTIPIDKVSKPIEQIILDVPEIENSKVEVISNQIENFGKDFYIEAEQKLEGILQEKKTEITEKIFTPKNIPAFIPTLGKLKSLILFPVFAWLGTFGAWFESLPIEIILLLAFFAGIFTTLFMILVIKHHQKVFDFLLNCYCSIANPKENNLIPTQVSDDKHLRDEEILNAING